MSNPIKKIKLIARAMGMFNISGRVGDIIQVNSELAEKMIEARVAELIGHGVEVEAQIEQTPTEKSISVKVTKKKVK